MLTFRPTVVIITHLNGKKCFHLMNTAPYLQYAHARICSIFSKDEIDRGSTLDAEIILVHEREVALARALIGYPEALDSACSSHSPHKLATQLHVIAQAFGSFYEVCPVLNAEYKTKISRLALCDLTARTLQTGLELLELTLHRECRVP